MADAPPTAAGPSEPALDTMTWVEVSKRTEEILARFENEETTFQRWEVKVVWEYWRGFEMMGLDPGVTVSKFMRDVVIPFASGRVHSRLRGQTRYEKAIGANKAKTYKVKSPVDEGPAVVYRKGSSPDAVSTLKETQGIHDSPEASSSSGPTESQPHPQPARWDLGAHLRATTAAAARATSPECQFEHIEDAAQYSLPGPTSPPPFHRAPITAAAENILKSPISNSKLVAHRPVARNEFPAPVTSLVEGHPELIKIVCNDKEEIVNAEDLVANNYLLRSTVESLNQTATSMQEIIEAQKGRIDSLSAYIASQHAKITNLNNKLALSEKADE